MVTPLTPSLPLASVFFLASEPDSPLGSGSDCGSGLALDPEGGPGLDLGSGGGLGGRTGFGVEGTDDAGEVMGLVSGSLL